MSPDIYVIFILISGIFSCTRQPFQNITQRELNSRLDSDRSVRNPSVLLQHPSESSAQVDSLMEPSVSYPSTSKGVNMRKPVNSISPDIVALGKKFKKLQQAKDTAMTKLKKIMKLSENPTFQKTLKKFTTPAMSFTMLQFREAGKNKLGRRFKQQEKLLALALYKQGPRAYRWMRKFFVLPSPLTLSRMIRSASLKPGVNENLFLQLKKVANRMKTNEKLSILLFDEIALSPHLDYNKRNDAISGFVDTGETKKKKIADHAMVFMLRGLYKNYKQPLVYAFCSKTTPKDQIVMQIKIIIRKLYEVGFIVVATICDQGATNVSAINYLINQTRGNYLSMNKELKNDIFEVDGNEIIPLYDIPHLMKGIRNNLLNKDLVCTINGQEKTAKWDHLIKLYKENPAYQGIRLMPKLTERHIIPNKIAKMKVKCATQVFSQTVAANMGYLASCGILPKECQETADILIFFDKLFDSFNGSMTKFKKKSGKPLIGPVTPNSIHKKVWAEAKPILKSMKYTKNGKTTIVPSLSHWLLTVKNTEYMINKLSQKYGLTSIWMRHLNQDPLENFFGCIRSHGYRNTSPTCAGFESAFASLLVNNLSSNHSPGANCEVDSCKVLKSLKTIFFRKSTTSNYAFELDYDDVGNFDFQDVAIKYSNQKIKAQLEYVTGYVLRKLKTKIFKNCAICKKDFFQDNKDDSTLIAREYFKNKCCLTYPNVNAVKCFSSIQDVVIHIIKKDCIKNNIKQYIKTVLAAIMSYTYITCKKHKNDAINEFENVSINLFLFNWCKDCNKLLNGSRNDFDTSDYIQKMCFDYNKIRNKK